MRALANLSRSLLDPQHLASCHLLVSAQLNIPWTSLVAQMVKCPPTMRETQVQSLGWEDLLEKEMATHSSIPAWRIPWMEEADRLQSMGSQRVGLSDFTFFLSFL